MLYMLDTNMATAAMRGDTVIDAKLRAVDDWCISAVTRSELRFGAALRAESMRIARLVEGFIAVAHTAPWDARAADAHGRLRAHLRLQGTPIGDFDEMIAGHALSLGAVLVTDNMKHFTRVPGLEVQNWLR